MLPSPGQCRARRLQNGQPILIRYRRADGTAVEVFAEVVRLRSRGYRLRLYDEDGSPGATSVAMVGRTWRDITRRCTIQVVEELSGPQLSQFMLFRDYSQSGCAPARHGFKQHALRASA